MLRTDPDCTLDDKRLDRGELAYLSSEEIARIVGEQSPTLELEYAEHYTWSYQIVALADLRFCLEEDEEPDGGWRSAYLRHKRSDQEAIASGSPIYAGRQKWLRRWCRDTSLYPVFLVVEDGQYRISDGYHGLAGAFWHELQGVAAFVGSPKPRYDLESGRPR